MERSHPHLPEPDQDTDRAYSWCFRTEGHSMPEEVLMEDTLIVEKENEVFHVRR